MRYLLLIALLLAACNSRQKRKEKIVDEIRSIEEEIRAKDSTIDAHGQYVILDTSILALVRAVATLKSEKDSLELELKKY